MVPDSDYSADLHTASVHALMQRFAVHSAHAHHVADTAQKLWLQLFPDEFHAPAILAWAGLLHEVGCRVSRNEYHHHSAYILANCQLPGFSATEQEELSQLVLGHRGKLKKMEAWMQTPINAVQLLCLRLAAVLCNTRRAPDMQGVQLARKGMHLYLQTPEGWSGHYPLSTQLLREEAAAIAKSDWTLSLDMG